MSPSVQPVLGDSALPASAGVVIVGGGIIGAAAGFFLARAGVSVAICEKGVIAGEQSSRNWGWCRTQGRDRRELPLALESLRIWRESEPLLRQQTGFRQCGTLQLCPDEASLAASASWVETVGRNVADARVIGGKEVAALLPGAEKAWVGAVYSKGDGGAEPALAAPAFALAAREAGASILTNCAVRSVETSGGRVTGVLTERGRIACDAVVIAGGVWTTQLCRTLGIRFPQLKVSECLVSTAPLDGPTISAKEKGFAFRKRLDGGYTISGGGTTAAEIGPDHLRFMGDFRQILGASWRTTAFRVSRQSLRECAPPRWRPNGRSRYERTRALDPAPSLRALARTRANIDAAFPFFRNAKVVERWAGFIDVTPDAIPVISPVDEMPGLFIGSGFSGHGFGLGPASGRLLADLILGTAPIVDPSPFRLTRLDGSRPLELGHL